MNKTLEAILYTSLVAFMPVAAPAAVAGGSIAGNGGDIVHCEPSPPSAFAGDYFLDYLATYVQSNGNQDIVPVASWEQSKARILNGLKTKAPELGLRFEEFLNGMNNFTDAAQPRIWIEASFGLEELDDQELFRKIPANCRGANGKPNITQFVRRTLSSGQVAYEFDPAIYARLRQSNPLQFSFAMVHEFLWDYTNNPDLIRRMNRLIHSSEFDKYDAATFANIMGRIGLNSPQTVRPGAPFNQGELDAKLLKDVELGNLDFVKYWLSLGASPNARDKNAKTALMFAAEGGAKTIAIFKLLASSGAYLDVVDNAGNTPLIYGARSGTRETVRLLIKAGVRIDIRNESDVTALIASTSPEVSTDLVLAGADVTLRSNNGYAPIHDAVDFESQELLDLLISKGAKADVLLDSLNLITFAILRNRPTLIESLIRLGVDVNQLDREERAPLDRAAENSPPEVVSLLIRSGAKVEDSRVGTSALYQAISAMKFESTRILVEAGADYRKKTFNPLELARRRQERNPENQDIRKIVTYLTPLVEGVVKEVSGTGKEKKPLLGAPCTGIGKTRAEELALQAALAQCQGMGFKECVKSAAKATTFETIQFEGKPYCQATAWAQGRYFPNPGQN